MTYPHIKSTRRSGDGDTLPLHHYTAPQIWRRNTALFSAQRIARPHINKRIISTDIATQRKSANAFAKEMELVPYLVAFLMINVNTGTDNICNCNPLLFKNVLHHRSQVQWLKQAGSCRIRDPGPRNFIIERSGAQLTSTMHREISAGSLRGPEIDKDPPPTILYFNHWSCPITKHSKVKAKGYQ